MQNLMIVVGNQAADLDSMVSAIAAARFVNSAGAESVPVISCPRQDFRLRGDAVELFTLAGYQLDCHSAPAELMFLDDVASVERLVLTDANEVGPHLSHLGGDVVGVFDHHRDQEQFMDAKWRIVDESAGSTCSLLVNSIFELDNPASCMDDKLAVLLFGTILMDTRNLSPGRFSQVDVLALNRLNDLVPKHMLDTKDELFQKLMDARNDVSKLCLKDMLRLDYKQVHEKQAHIGFSTLFETAQALSKRMSLETDMSQLMTSKGLHALFAITSAQADTARRGFFMCTVTDKLGEQLEQDLKERPDHVFSPEFLALPLCVSQGVSAHGFQLEPLSLGTGTARAKRGKCVHHFSSWSIPGSITRKTMLPGMLELVQRSLKLV